MGKISKALDKAIVHGENAQPSDSHTTKPANLTGTRKTPKPQKQGEKAGQPAPPSIEQWDERLGFAVEKFSAVAETIRKLRTKILHPESGKPIRSIMVSSSSASEGKSFICANLGISLAKSMERHALMVDCDLRRPNLQNLFGLHQEKGLSSYLYDGEKLPNLISKTGMDKLSIISSGPIPDNPAELLSSEKMAAMLEELTSRYDDRLILLDTPPFHAASETLVLSQQVDKVILVVRWGKSGRDNIKKMVDLIGKDKILGAVFNAFEMNILDRKMQGLSYHNYYTDPYE